MKKNFSFTDSRNGSKVIVILDKLFLVEIKKKPDGDANSSDISLIGNGGGGSFEIPDEDLEELEKIIGPCVRTKRKR